MYAISIVQGSTELYLHGPGVSAPFRSAARGVGGDEVGAGGRVEMLDVLLEGTDSQTLLALQALNRLIFSTPAGERVYLRCQSAPGEQALQAPILAARTERLPGFDSALAGERLRLTCPPYWQAAEIELPLTNSSGTGVTGGIELYNHTDADALHENFADLAAADLPGDLPAPARLEILNETAGQSIYDVYTALNVESSPLLFQHALEGEDCGSAAGGAAAASDAGCSGGAYQRAAWTGVTETRLIGWTLSAAQLVCLAGRPLIPILRLANVFTYTDLRLRWKVETGTFGSPTELAVSEVMTAAPNLGLQRLPPVILPPGGLGAGGSQNLLLSLYAQRDTAAGTHTVDIDFVQLLPADGFRHLAALTALPAGSTLVDDGLEGVVYSRDGSGGRLASHYPAFGGLLLVPGRDQRLVLLQRGASESTPGWKVRLRVFYTPRYAVN